MKRLSRYAYFFRSGKYGSLLYNSRTNTFAKISDNLYDALSHLKEHPEEVDSLLDSECGEICATLPQDARQPQGSCQPRHEFGFFGGLPRIEQGFRAVSQCRSLSWIYRGLHQLLRENEQPSNQRLFLSVASGKRLSCSVLSLTCYGRMLRDDLERVCG